MVKASVIACNGLRQKVIAKDWPSNVHSSVQHERRDHVVERTVGER